MASRAAPPSRHDTAARAQFRRAFAAALGAMKMLEKRGTSYQKPPKVALKDMDLNGQQTTSQLAFVAPDKEGLKLFAPGYQNRKRKDDQTEFWESYFKFKNSTKPQ